MYDLKITCKKMAIQLGIVGLSGCVTALLNYSIPLSTGENGAFFSILIVLLNGAQNYLKHAQDWYSLSQERQDSYNWKGGQSKMVEIKEAVVTEGMTIAKFIIMGLFGILLVGLGMKAIFGGNFATLATTIAGLL